MALPRATLLPTEAPSECSRYSSRALTQQWNPQLAPEERMDLFKLCADGLLLLGGWDAASCRLPG